MTRWRWSSSVSGLPVGVFPGEQRLTLTLLPAAVAAIGVGAAVYLARRGASYVAKAQAKRPKLAVSIRTLAAAVNDTKQLLLHRRGLPSVLGAIAYLGFDVLVLWTAFVAINAHPVPSFAVVLMAYIIGALGGSLPLPASVGSIAGMVGMLILYGVPHSAAVATVFLYQAVGLIVPLAGGTTAYVLLRRQLGPLPAGSSASDWTAEEDGTVTDGHPLRPEDSPDVAVQNPPAG